jgi:hypothetical protein
MAIVFVVEDRTGACVPLAKEYDNEDIWEPHGNNFVCTIIPDIEVGINGNKYEYIINNALDYIIYVIDTDTSEILSEKINAVDLIDILSDDKENLLQSSNNKIDYNLLGITVTLYTKTLIKYKGINKYLSITY